MVLTFKLVNPLGDVSKENFLLNMGTIPLSVQTMLQSFKTFDPLSPNAALFSNDLILKSQEQANDLKILVKYYEDSYNVDDLTERPLSKWCHAFSEHVRNARLNGEMTPVDVMAKLLMHIRNCMRLHVDTLKGDGYNSDFFKQCIDVILNADKTDLRTVCL